MAKAKTKRKGADAIKLLKEDHDKVKKAFKRFEKLDHEEDQQEMQEIVREVCNDLKVHTTLEEEIFYPAVRSAIEDDDLMNEAQVEHNSAKELIELLEGMDPGDEMYAATFTVLGEYVMHHVEEEEGEMFPSARKAKVDFAELGEQMKARKEELMETETV